MAGKFVLSVCCAGGLLWSTQAWAQDQTPAPCGPPAATIPVALPLHPFAAAPTGDDCTIFVSLSSTVKGGHGAVALLRRAGDVVSVAQTAAMPGQQPAMMVLTKDEKLLVVADDDDVAFVDTAKLASGDTDPVLGKIGDLGEGVVGVALSPDERTLFVSIERANAVVVIDLEKARASGFVPDTILGQIPTGIAPVGLAVSSDGRFLYATSENEPSQPIACLPESGKGKEPNHPQGSLRVIDVALARTDAARATLATVPSGCNPVRVVLSPLGDRAYVTARGDNKVVVFDTAKLQSDPADAQIAAVPTGSSPVGLALTTDGGNLFVTNSNRFGPARHDNQALDVIDTGRIADGQTALIGKIPVGAFPRELRITDRNVLYVTNFLSDTVELVPLPFVPTPAAPAADAPAADATAAEPPSN